MKKEQHNKSQYFQCCICNAVFKDDQESNMKIYSKSESTKVLSQLKILKKINSAKKMICL